MWKCSETHYVRIYFIIISQFCHMLGPRRAQRPLGPRGAPGQGALGAPLLGDPGAPRGPNGPLVSFGAQSMQKVWQKYAKSVNSYFLHTLVILFAYFWHTSGILLAYFWHTLDTLAYFLQTFRHTCFILISYFELFLVFRRLCYMNITTYDHVRSIHITCAEMWA